MSDELKIIIPVEIDKTASDNNIKNYLKNIQNTAGVKITIEDNTQQQTQLTNQANNLINKISKNISTIVPKIEFDTKNMTVLQHQFEALAKQMAESEGLAFSKVKIRKPMDDGSGTKKLSADLVFYDDILKQTITDTYTLDEKSGSLYKSMSVYDSNVRQATKSAEDQAKAQKLVETQVITLTEKINTLKNSYDKILNIPLNENGDTLNKQFDKVLGNLSNVGDSKDLRIVREELNGISQQAKTLDALMVKDQPSRAIEKLPKQIDTARNSLERLTESFNLYNNVPVENIDKLSELKDSLSKIDNINIAEDKVKEVARITTGVSDLSQKLQIYEEQQKRINSELLKANSINSKISSLTGLQKKGQFTDQTTEIDNLINKYKNLQAELNKTEAGTPEYRKLIDDLENLNKEYFDTTGKIKIFNQEMAATATFNKFTQNLNLAGKKLEAYGKKYSALFNDKNLTEQFYNLGKQKANIGSPDELNQWNKEFSTFDKNVEIAGLKTKTFTEIIKDNIKAFTNWFLIGGGVAGIVRELKNVVTIVSDLDKVMTDLKKVTDETDESYRKLLKNANTEASRLGATTKELISSTADYAKIGYDMADAFKLAQDALVYRNVGDISIENATKSLISASQAFGVQIQDNIDIIDSFNLIGNKYSVTSAGIGEALQKSASGLSAANNDLAESIALVTAANKVVQDPSQVGVALKTVAMRLRNTSGKLEEMGEDAEGAALSITKLQQQIYKLTGDKVNIMLDNDTFKSTYDILLEISRVWKDISDVDQAQLLELIAGKQNCLYVQKCA